MTEEVKMRVLKVGLGAAIAVCLLLAGSVALAAGATAGGPVQVFVKSGSGPRGTILVTGAIGDYGKTVSVDKNGKVDNNGNFQKVTLQKGSFWVDVTGLNKKLNKSQPAINKATCSVLFSASAPTNLFRGTRLYKGISGKVKIRVTFASLAPRFSSGPRKGQCNFANNVRPLSQSQSITGSGRVRFK
jgi:hypothetical protein